MYLTYEAFFFGFVFFLKHLAYIIGIIFHSWNNLHSWINAPLFVGSLAMCAAGIQEQQRLQRWWPLTVEKFYSFCENNLHSSQLKGHFYFRILR